MTELLPCPFCGSEAEVYNVQESVSWHVEKPYTVSHRGKADCPVDFAWFETEEEAVKAWSTRAT